jgi:hypothetical protein
LDPAVTASWIGPIGAETWAESEEERVAVALMMLPLMVAPVLDYPYWGRPSNLPFHLGILFEDHLV